MNFFKNICLASAVGALALTACGDDDTAPVVAPEVAVFEIEDATVAAYAVNYANIVRASYADALADAENLQAVLNTFTANPTEANLTAAKEAWLDSRESYGPTEAYRFAGGPIDATDDSPEGNLNSWPLDESYIDYVDGQVEGTVNIINDLETYPELNKEILNGLNGVVSEENVSVGYHAIEFLLWGQDLTAPSEELPGQRSFNDFVDDEAENADRRRAYLTITAEILIDDLTTLVNEWEEGANYDATFKAIESQELIETIFASLGEFASSELAIERMEVALQNQDQEDEHSCFSDNTDRDIRLNFEGVKNLYFGTYTANDGTVVTGTSLEDVIASVNSDGAAAIAEAINAADEAIEATPVPFDLAISEGPSSTQGALVGAAVDTLVAIGDQLSTVGAAIGLSINL